MLLMMLNNLAIDVTKLGEDAVGKHCWVQLGSDKRTANFVYIRNAVTNLAIPINHFLFIF